MSLQTKALDSGPNPPGREYLVRTQQFMPGGLSNRHVSHAWKQLTCHPALSRAFICGSISSYYLFRWRNEQSFVRGAPLKTERDMNTANYHGIEAPSSMWLRAVSLRQNRFKASKL